MDTYKPTWRDPIEYALDTGLISESEIETASQSRDLKYNIKRWHNANLAIDHLIHVDSLRPSMADTVRAEARDFCRAWLGLRTSPTPGRYIAVQEEAGVALLLLAAGVISGHESGDNKELMDAWVIASECVVPEKPMPPYVSEGEE